jgi:hypothetical protein
MRSGVGGGSKVRKNILEKRGKVNGSDSRVSCQGTEGQKEVERKRGFLVYSFTKERNIS